MVVILLAWLLGADQAKWMAGPASASVIVLGGRQVLACARRAG
jgi:hypothetical protein